MFDEIFAPGRKHTEDERKRLELTRVDLNDGDPGRGPIDLSSGKVVVRPPERERGGTPGPTEPASAPDRPLPEPDGPASDRDRIPPDTDGTAADPDGAAADPDGAVSETDGPASETEGSSVSETHGPVSGPDETSTGLDGPRDR
ncbi:DUF6191 domain-containing protein [Streptomyces sp. NPDC047990]|uniref:DUF6191 domain-containing protein n=1 Tax=Streptomyces sp. NPDC047990 TaxID=3365496 RepID=UPI00371C353C